MHSFGRNHAVFPLHALGREPGQPTFAANNQLLLIIRSYSLLFIEGLFTQSSGVFQGLWLIRVSA